MKKILTCVIAAVWILTAVSSALAANDERLLGGWSWEATEGDGYFERYEFTFYKDGKAHMHNRLPGMIEEREDMTWETDGDTLRMFYAGKPDAEDTDMVFTYKFARGVLVMNFTGAETEMVMERMK